MKALTPTQMKQLNEIYGNGLFFSRRTMKFFKDTMRDFGSYLENGRSILYNKKRGSKWIFNNKTSSLDSYPINS